MEGVTAWQRVFACRWIIIRRGDLASASSASDPFRGGNRRGGRSCERPRGGHRS